MMDLGSTAKARKARNLSFALCVVIGLDPTGNSSITADRYRGGGSSKRAKIPSGAMDGESEGILQSN